MALEKEQKQRALNMIWNTAGDYAVQPALKVFDAEGRADLYWNSIIGAVYAHYDAAPLEAMLRSFRGSVAEYELENLFWLGLENAAYQKELSARPALASLRRAYARDYLAHDPPTEDRLTLDKLTRAHFQRALGECVTLAPPYDAMLEALEFPPTLDTQALIARATELFKKYFHYDPEHLEQTEQEQEPEGKGFRLPAFLRFGKRKQVVAEKPSVRRFGVGQGDYVPLTGDAGDIDVNESGIDAMTESQLRAFMANFFGAPLYPPHELAAMERSLCTGNHAGCRLHFTRGDFADKKGYKGKGDYLKMSALRQEKKNRAYYEANRTQSQLSILRLSARIRNSLLTQFQTSTVTGEAGALCAGRVWRAEKLNDARIFKRTQRGDSGNISVDILLDASSSQSTRQEKIAAQAYIIAESLTRCAIPVRVSSFCSLRGCTALLLLRDYTETNKNDNVFGYFTAGCNRDGLALRAEGALLKRTDAEHRLLILLSDVRPNATQRVEVTPGVWRAYTDDTAVRDTAAEVRALRREGISVLCVFTGEDEALPSVKLVYEAGYTRIKDLDHFAEAVGKLIQDEIKEM